MQEETEYINVYGARVHNLKNIDAEIPRNSLTVITHSILFLPKGSAAISRPFQPMPVTSWEIWNVRTWIR